MVLQRMCVCVCVWRSSKQTTKQQNKNTLKMRKKKKKSLYMFGLKIAKKNKYYKIKNYSSSIASSRILSK